MDVLMGSIDVRDLLSSSLSIKSRVRSYVLSHRDDFASIFSLSASSSASVASLSDSLADALRLLSDRPLDGEIRGLAREICERRRELQEKREALGVVEVIRGVLERLGLVKERLGDGRLKEAAIMMKELKEGLGLGLESEEEENEPAVFGFLRKECLDCFDELQGILAKNMGEAVQFEVENGSVIVRLKPITAGANDIDLYTTLEAMEIVGVLDYGLAKTADLMIKHVINPAISNVSVDIFVEEFDEGSVVKHEAILKLLPSSEYKEHLDGPIIYARLTEVVKFIYKFVCVENGAWMQCFGRLTWPRMSDLIITFFLSKAVPDDASKMVDFQNVIRYTAEFETSLKEMKFISMTENKEDRLSHFTHNVEVHFASRKKLEILAKSRKILLQFDHLFSSDAKGSSKDSSFLEGFSEHAADLLFQHGRCFISKAVSQLMELVHATLKDACLSSSRVAKEFYHAARDVLLLYKAIVPIKLEKQLNNISQLAIIVHNDCYYLSQEVLGLAFEYRVNFPSGLKKLAVFADIAPNFYQMAERILQKQIQLVGNSLMEAIDGADGFQNTHQPQQYESAKFSIEQVVFILEKVHIIWEPLMPASVYKKTMYILLDSVFSRITKDLLLLDDMAAEETLQLQRLIHMTLENLSSLSESLIANGDEKYSSLKSILDHLDMKIPSLRKIRKLADLLDMPLRSITETWESGELHSCGFTASEVENFVKAIFTDSPLRKECLWRIQDSFS
ncbi:uncharacterized protein A4U43_C05F31980 [Asparagus officinalis]|uniref:Centromere/kinetochore protein zw10 homolog n=1 Tax=Asparagus officinalis TaxID=4686 RepID=A0A5P1EVZ9_ASPOF|nr:centromere/kinetochore protein zw10 homolog [Asparagus officinalis]ONK70268.1 uncharacterized protein A4U43_C05F31980 [Asparagus officinalis]